MSCVIRRHEPTDSGYNQLCFSGGDKEGLKGGAWRLLFSPRWPIWLAGDKWQITLNLAGIAYIFLTRTILICYLRSLSMSQSILSAASSMPRPAACRHPLCDCTPGQACRLVEIDGNRALINRLMGLGVRIGSEIRVLQQRGQDVVITSTGNRIALGGAIARHLQVESLS